VLFSHNEVKRIIEGNNSNLKPLQSCNFSSKKASKEIRNLFRKGATRYIRRKIRKYFHMKGYSNRELSSEVDQLNNCLIDELVSDIEKQKQSALDRISPKMGPENKPDSFRLLSYDQYKMFNLIGRDQMPYQKPTLSTPPVKKTEVTAEKSDVVKQPLEGPVIPKPELVQAVNKEKANFDRMNGVYKQLGYNTLCVRTETGIELPLDTWDTYVHMCYTRNIVMPLGFSKNGPIVGGYKGKRGRGKGKGKARKRRGKGKKHMDCSDGNVYESSALMVTDATGALNIVIALNNPQQIFAGVTATGAQDLASNWDAYSVERVSMSTQIRAPINARQGEWNLICDHDSSPPSTAITQNLLLTYTSKRTYSSQAAPRWSVVPRKLSQCEYISAVGADPEPAVIVQKGKYDWNTPPSNGFMYVKLIGGPASTNIGTIYVRVHVKAWYKRRLATAIGPMMNVPLLEEPECEEESSSEEKIIKKKVRGTTIK